MLQCFADDKEFSALLFIGSASRDDVLSLTMYTTHTRVSDTRIYIYIYIYKHTSNPWESNHRDGPAGHNNHRDDTAGHEIIEHKTNEDNTKIWGKCKEM